jgi:spore coat polysaccharide biosynthesis protein SpsF
MMPNAAVILQARLASHRLPGKALARLDGRSLLEHCLGRLRAESPVPVVLATTDRPEDDALEAEATRLGVRTFRGPSDDVLTRFIRAAQALRLDRVVRATGDNPAVDMAAPARVLALMAATGADHVTESELPYGAAVEAVSVSALVRADRHAGDAADREHVTTLIRRDRSRFQSVTRRAPAPLRRPDLRLTVDTAEDLEFMRCLLERVPKTVRGYAPLETIIAAAVPVSLAESGR